MDHSKRNDYGYVTSRKGPVYHYRNDGDDLRDLGWATLIAAFFIALVGIIVFVIFPLPAHAQPVIINHGPWKATSFWTGVVAEDCYLRSKAWTYEDQVNLYTHISWVVWNRVEKGMSHGLVAAKRKNLDKFVEDNDTYIIAMRGFSIVDAAIEAQQNVLFNGVPDPTGGATHYEHTGRYKKPGWAKKMKITKILFKGTKDEITFYREAKQ